MPFSNETVFITGFPGFLAERLVKHLAKLHAHFILLVQPSLLNRARSDVSRIATETGAPVENFMIVPGDITEDNLGMSAAHVEHARKETTTLFHLAAIYDLAVTRDVALRVNVNGTRNVNQFARSLDHLWRYHYVSTCYVAGRREGLIMETELLHEAGF